MKKKSRIKELRRELGKLGYTLTKENAPLPRIPLKWHSLEYLEDILGEEKARAVYDSQDPPRIGVPPSRA
jgi:hypothetical protein